MFRSQDQFAAVEVLLSEQDLAFLDGVSTPGRAVVAYYLDDDFADWNASRFRW